MERPIFQPVGTPVEQLDTPALVLDLDVMVNRISLFRYKIAMNSCFLQHYCKSCLFQMIIHQKAHLLLQLNNLMY